MYWSIVKICIFYYDNYTNIQELQFERRLALVNKNNQTYTYTARSINDPENIITFTLDDGHLRVSLAGLFDQAGVITQSDSPSDQLKQQIKTQAKPMALKVTEQLSGPVHVNDVQASLNDEELRITLWQRLAGLRLAPIMIHMVRYFH